MTKLEELGFGKDDCEKALVQSQGRLNDAAMWLTKHATPIPTGQQPRSKNVFNISGFEVRSSIQDANLKKN